MGAVGFLPLFDGPGYEQSLATGLLVPSTAAIAVALAKDATPLARVGRGVLLGLALAGISLLTAIGHGLRVGICEWWGALLYFALTAGLGCVMGGVWGAVVGELRRRRWLTVLLAIAGPLGCALISVGRFVTSPMIFAYDPFVGYFSGTLYDTVIDAGTPMLTYRLGSFCTVMAVVLFASVMERTDRGVRLVLRDARSRWRGALAVVATLTSTAIIVAGSWLGHFSTVASITKNLGAEKHGARCDVVYPSTTREQEANLLVKDCEEELAFVEKRLGARGPARVRAFFFRDPDDKKRQMGAAHTYIAKPWREEVYLQMGGYPHPVLGHELAHVVAGSFGRGPFRISGGLGGLLPNPGLIEGVAVAASPDDEDLTDAQWARAMLDIGILPNMQRVFSLSFLGDASAKSYTLAGAFVSWVGGRWGFDVVRAWFGGGDIEALTHLDWAALDREFRASLAALPLPPEAASFAKAKFARPGIFGRKCPHLVDSLRHDADVCRDTQRFEEAIKLYREVLVKDRNDFASQNAVAAVERRHGDRQKGERELLAMANADDATVPRIYRDRAEETLADADLVEGQFLTAAERYDGIAKRTVDEDVARTLEVKALGARDPAARLAIKALLLGDEKHGPDIYLGGVELGEWSPNDTSGLAQYLIGRNLVGRGFFEYGGATLDAALTHDLPTLRIRRETVRQRAVAACALDDQAALAKEKALIEGPNDPFVGAAGGRRESTLSMIARCTTGQ